MCVIERCERLDVEAIHHDAVFPSRGGELPLHVGIGRHDDALPRSKDSREGGDFIRAPLWAVVEEHDTAVFLVVDPALLRYLGLEDSPVPPAAVVCSTGWRIHGVLDIPVEVSLVVGGEVVLLTRGLPRFHRTGQSLAAGAAVRLARLRALSRRGDLAASKEEEGGQ